MELHSKILIHVSNENGSNKINSNVEREGEKVNDVCSECIRTNTIH